MSQNDDNRRLALANALKAATVQNAAPASTVSNLGLAQAYQQHLSQAAENGTTPLTMAQFQAQRQQ